MAIFTNPTYMLPGIAYNKRIWQYRLGNHGARPDQRKTTDLVSAIDGGIGSYTGSFANHCLFVFVFANDGASRVGHIGKNHAGAEKNIVFTNNARVNGNIVLDFYIITQYNARGNH